MSTWNDFPGLKFYWADIQAAAKAHNLDANLVAAIVVQESGANTDAFRHERLFWNRYLKRLPQWTALNPRRVSSSYGLMQIMFPVAQERGLAKDVPPEALFGPELGLEFGCRQLSYCMDWIDAKYPQAPGADRLRAAIASYNGGLQGPDALRPDNRAYADSVLKLYTALQADPKV
jgi:soluble lytic murein transglycosylase-like protein